MIDSWASMDVNSVVCAVASNCPALSELSAFDLPMDTFGHIRKCKVKLKRLWNKCQNGGALPVTDITLMLIGMCPVLEELHLVAKSDVDGSGEVTDVGLLAFTERASTLPYIKAEAGIFQFS